MRTDNERLLDEYVGTQHTIHDYTCNMQSRRAARVDAKTLRAHILQLMDDGVILPAYKNAPDDY